MTNKITNISRFQKKIIMVLMDCILLIAILFASYSIRLDYWYFPKDDSIRLILVAPVIGIPIFAKFGLYKSVIRHIDFNVLWSVLQAVSLYALIWGLAAFFTQADIVRDRGFDIGIIPRSVIVINWLLAILVISGVRICARFILSDNIKFSILNYDFKHKINNVNSGSSRVLIYGAGRAGVQLAIALNNSNKLHPVAFIDDNKDLQESNISGLKVFSINDIEELINKLQVEEVLIS
jgi:FlaA1/EpsC-like NDP-sugar epimerase